MIKSCFNCDLCLSRKRIVNGEGLIPAPIIFIGEAPGQREDTTGLPFVGKSGQYLTSILLKLNFRRDKHYYITNVCKCRPEGNREPTVKEVESCLPYLRNELDMVQPKIICLLGSTALKVFTGNQAMRITCNRGKWFKVLDYNIIATYHPSAILQDKNKEIDFISDLKQVAGLYRQFNPLHQTYI